MTDQYDDQEAAPRRATDPLVLLLYAAGIVLLVLLAAPLFIGKAHAEGISKKAAPIAADETTLSSTAARWSGPWVAATLGYAVQSTDIEDVSFATKDITYGGAVGWDHQFAGTNLLVGVGADIDFTRAESAVASWDRQWSVWGRGGVLLSPSLLAYGLAGYTELNGAFAVPELGDRRGLTLGGGLEALFKDGWFARAEGRWVDLGGDAGVESAQYAARVSIGYRFGAGK
jgi:opacity protein-like surface antigen